MFCFSCKPIVELSFEAKSISKKLEKLTYFYLITSVIKIIFGDFSSFINDIFIILLTLLTFSGANYFIAAILIFTILYQNFFIMIGLALLYQNYYLGFLNMVSWILIFYLIIIVTSLILSFLILYYSFLAYKEYKALFIEQHRFREYCINS